MRPRRNRSALATKRSTCGFVLLWVLLLLPLLMTLLAAGLTRSNNEYSAAGLSATNEQALHLAEAGIDDALAVLNTSSLGWNDELLGPDGKPGTSDDGLLSIGSSVSMSPGTYAVRVFDDADEGVLQNDPTTDTDGIIRILSTGVVGQSRRQIEVYLAALFNNLAISAQVDIHLRQPSIMGDVHANGNILVDQVSYLLGCSQATATGIVDQSKATLSYDPTCSSVQSGVPPITFPIPNAADLWAAVKAGNWNLPDITATVVLPSQEVAGYTIPLALLPNTPQTIQLSGGTGPSTMVVFNGNSLRVRERIGTFNCKKIKGVEVCTCIAPLNLSIIALGGGSISFEQPVCLRGLIWAEGDITISQGSTISGAIVSAQGTIDVKDNSAITYDRAAIQTALLPGFSGSTMLSWREQ